MTLKEWFAMQEKLDQYITAEHGLEGKDLIEKRILALFVELGELANETRCFKFWSTKPPSDSEVILEEYVDGVHFILSIGLESGFANEDISLVSSEQNENMERSFLKMFQLINHFQQSRSAEDFGHMLHQYIIFGQTLGFSLEEIQEAYIKKNEVNFTRQQEGY